MHPPARTGAVIEAQLMDAYTGLIHANRNLLYRRNLRLQNNLNAALRDSLVNTIHITQNDRHKTIVEQYLTTYLDYQQMVIFGDLCQILSWQNNVRTPIDESGQVS